MTITFLTVGAATIAATATLVATGAPLAPVTTCECGGYLAYLRGRPTHIDTCADCITDYPAPCDLADHHRTCDRPEPAQCAHYGCHADNALDSECANLHPACCGRCGCLD